MVRPLGWACVFCTGGWLLGFSSAGCQAEDPRASPPTLPEVTLVVASGRQFRGQIDPQSGPDRLVLRSQAQGMTLWRPIAWERIVAAEVQGRPVSLAQLQDWSFQVRETSPKEAGRGRPGMPPAVGDRANASPGSLTATPSSAAAAEQHASDRVVQLRLDAYVANWDGDVEVDGLVVEVMPLAADGTIVPMSGTLEVELFGLQRRVFSQAPRSGGDTLELIERWTRAVRPDEVSASGLRCTLPFGAIHPELRPDWLAWWYGLVHVRLSVPGQGVFEASRDGVRLRPWSPVRDRLERSGTGRMLPTERLGRPD